jgi:predicted transcriptional regulator
MLTKTELINSLESLPENLTVDQVIDHIVFVEKVQKGIEDSEKGRISTKQEAQKILDKWLK